MIKSLITKLLEPRHFWRTAGFDELSELYTAQLLRSLGISLVGVFTPIYLYKIGYSLASIALFHVFWFLLRPIIDVLGAYVIARIGPKHTMLLSSLLHILYLGLILTIKDLHWPLMLVATVGSAAYSLHLLAVYVDFSKIKHTKHGGKELGYLESVQKVGGVLGPLIGGLIANFYDPRYTVSLAMLVLLLSTIPLFLSSEAVKVHQKITFKGLPIKRRVWDYVSAVPATIENTVAIIIWPLFAAIYILGDNTFAKLGLVAAISTAVSLLFIQAIGRIIDRSKGRGLMRLSLSLNSLLHLSRLFISTPLGFLGVNLANEPLMAGSRMPYMKGLYDAADSLPGYRIAYLTSISIVDSIARLLLWVGVWIGLAFFGGQVVLQATFILAAICSFGVMAERFEALNEKPKGI